MCFYPAAGGEASVGFREVLRPAANCVAGAQAGVDEVDRLFENPREVDVVYSELVVLEADENRDGRSTSTFGATL